MARLEYAVCDRIDSGPLAGLADDLFQLGLMYCAGRDVDLDLVSAHKWFNLAAMRGNTEARRYRTEIARDMTRAQVARAQRLAREWVCKPAAASQRPAS